MDAFEIARELLGDIQRLSPGQLAQLRAIDHKYWQAVNRMLEPNGAAKDAGAEPALSAEQTAELRAMLERDVRALTA